MPKKVEEKYLRGLTKDTFLLALTSLFADISTEMLYPILPIFLTQVLSAPASIIGVVEGVAQGTQNIIQGFSGWISDRLKNKKGPALVGYAIAAISKPFMGASAIWQQLLGGRFADRLGSGMRSAPRDALIAQSASGTHRARAFGLEGFGDNFGAVLGPLIAVALLYSFGLSLRSIFYLAFIPGLIAFILILFVKEKKEKSTKIKEKVNLKNFSSPYWKYIAAIAIFSLGNSTNAFLILRLKDIGIGTETTIFVYAFLNLVAAIISYPAGSWADKLGRKKVFLLSLFIFAVVYFGFAISSSVLLISFLFILYGAHQGIFRTVGKTMAIDFAPTNLRATGVGIFSSTVGIFSFLASIIGGQLWVRFGSSSTFLFGLFFATASFIFSLFLVTGKKVFS